MAPSQSPVPATPDEWFAAGEAAFESFVADAAHHGVAPDGNLRFVRDDTSPTPYYEPETLSIGFGMPDPAGIKGRMHFIFAARALGLDSVDAAIAAIAAQIPFLVAHETTHHLRHLYGAPIENDFVEEEVVNVVALAWLQEHPVYRSTLDLLRTQSAEVGDKLLALTPDTGRYVLGRSLDLAEVLVAQDRVSRARAEELRRLALAVREPLVDVLRAAGDVSERDVMEALLAQSECESYFNARYMANITEYTLFGTEWLRAYLERTEFPTFPEALAEHVLTGDWERARTGETIAMFSAVTRHPSDELAAAGVEALGAEGGTGVIDVLLEAAEGRRPAVRAAALRALAERAPRDERALEAAAAALAGETDAGVRAAAALVLAAAGGNSAAAGIGELRRMLAGPGSEEMLGCLAVVAIAALEDELVATAAARSPTARALSAKALAGLRSQPAVRALVGLLEDPDDAVRRHAARGLAGASGVAVFARLVEALGDPALPVREAAAEALAARGQEAVPALSEASGGIEMRSEAALVRHALGDPVAADAIESLLDALVPRAEALSGLRRSITVDGPVTELLSDALLERERKVVRLALRLAGALGNAGTMQIALRGLASEDAELRAIAAGLAVAALPAGVRARLEPLVTGGAAASPASQAGDASAALHALAAGDDPLLADLAAEAVRSRERPVAGGDDEEARVLTTAEKMMFLRAVPIFATVEAEDLRRLAAEVTIERHAAGERIFALGDEADGVYVVVAGRVSLEEGGRETRGAQIAEVAPRQVFGEMDLISGQPYSSAAYALRDTSLLKLGGEAFFRLSSREPRVLVEVIRVLSNRLRTAQSGGASPPARDVAERGLSAIWSGSGLHRGIVDISRLDAEPGDDAPEPGVGGP